MKTKIIKTLVFVCALEAVLLAVAVQKIHTQEVTVNKQEKTLEDDTELIKLLQYGNGAYKEEDDTTQIR